MDYLLEIARIVDGAVKGDRAKVVAYVEQLARKLREADDYASAERLVRTARGATASEVTAAGTATSPRLPVDGESRLALADEEWIEPEEVAVVLDASLDEQVGEFIRYVKAADRLLASRVGIAPSMIIYGPPGVGKTELARFIAAQLRLPLVTARSDSLISSFLGSTAKNLRMLFDHAKGRPCLLFLDEFDSVAKLRDDQHELGELKRVVVSLLQNIDALDNQTVLLAATNHHHLLDPAVWRRFTYRLEMRLPGMAARRRLFELFLDGQLPSADQAVEFASLAEGLTGADIRQVCENAIRAAVIEDRSIVDAVEVLKAIVHHRLGRDADFTTTEPDRVKAVRDLDPGLFTLKRLAALFHSSEATISRRLNEGSGHAGRRTKASDQGGASAGTRPAAGTSRRQSTQNLR